MSIDIKNRKGLTCSSYPTGLEQERKWYCNKQGKYLKTIKFTQSMIDDKNSVFSINAG